MRGHLQENLSELGKTSILVLSNMYGTLVLVVLLSYGLAFLPFAIWKRSDNSRQVYEELMEADQACQESKDARVEFSKQAKICRNLVQDHADPSNEQYMAILQEEIPGEDLEGQTIFSSNLFKPQVKPGQVVDEDFIAACRFELNLKMSVYRRKRALWLSMYRAIRRKVTQPV